VNLSQALIAVPMICYLGTAINEATRGNWAMASVFVCYAGANVGLLALAR
jgi:hypothetical protein